MAAENLIEKMAAEFKAAMANPRRPSELADELVTLYDHKGRPHRLPPIVAREILAAQAAAPRQQHETLTEAPPSDESEPGTKHPTAVLDAMEKAATEPIPDPEHKCHCGSTFTTAAGLKRHQTRMHKPEA